jgi:hypothetical protein
MKIKGSSVQQTLDFVKEKFPNRYSEWMNKLPEDTQKLLSGIIMPISWYPIQEGVIIPTQVIGEVFYNDPIKGSYEVGKYSAGKALNGVYKVFMRIATPHFLVSKAALIFSSYYDKADIKAVEIDQKKTELQFFNFTEDEKFLFYRVAGWIQGALDVLKTKNAKTDIQYFTKDDKFACKIVISWD